jgi:phosphoglycolate phosphatase-like HAD superfamily hydrolase
MSLVGAVTFFDIGDTLVSVTISPSGDRIERLAVHANVPGVLAELGARGVRLGIISDRGPIPAEEVDRALQAAGLWGFLEPGLVVYGPKDTPSIFEQAATRAGVAELLLFVGENAGERAQALLARFLVAERPELALSVLEENSAAAGDRERTT